MKRPSVLFWGMDGPFSAEPLLALLAAGIAVKAVIMPADEDSTGLRPLPAAPGPFSAGELPLTNPYLNPGVRQIAHLHQIPVYGVGKLTHAQVNAEVGDLLADLQPDVACVACFPQRIPASLLSLPRRGFLNLHPSLLPDYRGPAPLFWIFQRGESRSGVTVHFMDAEFDTGDVARQAPVSLTDGITGPQADHLLGQVGGRLLAETVHALAAGAQARHAQAAVGSYFPMPRAADFALQTNWSARRAYNFMRGTAEWGRLYTVSVDGENLELTSALSFDPVARLGRPILRDGGVINIQFSHGVLTALPA